VSIVEFLRTRSGEYELLAEWHAERAPLDDQLGIVLREVAEAIEVGWGRKRMRGAGDLVAGNA
jgi:hypothetical protein